MYGSAQSEPTASSAGWASRACHNLAVSVALATAEKWPYLSPDDQPLVAELARRGVATSIGAWSDASINWSGFDLVVIRSCWDYHLRRDQFLRWADSIPRLFNPPPIVRWNSHKSYLLDLARKGVTIPRTELLSLPSDVVIVKPAVSASARETHRLEAHGEVIVQEYVAEIESAGEWSVVFFDRTFSHAVRKLPKRGDFRVQQELGGSADLATPPRVVVDSCEQILRLIDGDVMYARVDVVERTAGVTLMELELIEPMLFLEAEPRAAVMFADAIERRLQSRA